MTGLIIGGKSVEVPGLKIVNFLDDKRLRRGPEDGKKDKGRWVKQVIIHTTKGIPGGKIKTPQHVKVGSAALDKDFNTAAYWRNDPKRSGAHLVIDADGSVGCIADLADEVMYHAGQSGINNSSIGIELYQLQDGGIYEATLLACIRLCNALSEIFGIQRQIHVPYSKKAIKRLNTGGKDCVGFFGHRDVSNNRGFGDPGDIIMDMLGAAGYERYNFEKGEDLVVWKNRQTMIGATPDGIPGPNTVRALEAGGFPHGLWVLGDKVLIPEIVALETEASPTVASEIHPSPETFWGSVFDVFRKFLGKEKI